VVLPVVQVVQVLPVLPVLMVLEKESEDAKLPQQVVYIDFHRQSSSWRIVEEREQGSKKLDFLKTDEDEV
jgi:hypothetical protein